MEYIAAFIVSLFVIADAALLPSGISSSSALASGFQSNLQNFSTAAPLAKASPVQPQQPSITGPAFHVYSDYSTSISTVTVPSGVTTYAFINEQIGETVVAGPTTITQTWIDKNVDFSFYSTPSVLFQKWDPAPFTFDGTSGFWGGVLPSSVGPASKWQSWLSFTEYARLPVCTADYSAFIAKEPLTTITTVVGIAPTSETCWGCGVDTGFGYTETIQTNGVDQDYCCGFCNFDFASVDMFYWPVANPTNTWCLTDRATAASNITNNTPAMLLERTAEPYITTAPGKGIYATDSDGFVYTSPSIYVKFPSLCAQDFCGYIGPQSPISTTLAFAPGELSTYDGWDYRGGGVVSVQPFDPAHMPCGSQSGTRLQVDYAGTHTNFFTQSGTGMTGTYRPTFVQPPGLNKLFQGWSNCTAATGFNGVDPPHTLIPATNMIAPITRADQANGQSTPAAPVPTTSPLPANTRAAADPAQEPKPTADPPQGDRNTIHGSSAVPDVKIPEQTTVALVAHPEVSAVEAQQQSPGIAPDPTHVVGSDPANGGKAFTAATLSLGNSWQSNAAPLHSAEPASDIADLPSGSSLQLAVSAGSGNADPASVWANPLGTASQSLSGQELHMPQASHWAVGGFTFSAVPSAAPKVASESNADGGWGSGPSIDPAGLSSTSVTIANAGEAPTPPALGMMIDDKTLLAGGPPVSVSGTIISLASSHIIIGTSTMSLPSLIATPAMTSVQPLPIFTLAGQTYTANPAGFAIGSASLLPGGSAISMSGTTVSLASSQLLIGTSTLLLPTALPISSTPTSYITIGSETIALGASAIIVAGNTLRPGAEAITVNGEQVSLGPSLLIVGSRTETFAPVLISATPGAGSATSNAANIGALVMAGLGQVDGGAVAAPSQTRTGVGSSASGSGSGAQTFTGGGRKGTPPPLQGFWMVAWFGGVAVLCFI